MEDAHAVVLDLDEGGSSDKNAFFAVYDGHGGTCSPLHVRSELDNVCRRDGCPICWAQCTQAAYDRRIVSCQAL